MSRPDPSPLALVAATPERREDEAGISVGLPVGAQDRQSLLRQGDHAVLRPLAAVDMDHHAVAVDVAHLQVERLLEA